MPPELLGQYPLLKSDCTVPGTVEKLRRFGELAPEDRPRSSLTGLHLLAVRIMYNKGEIPRQICDPARQVPMVMQHSLDGGDYDLAV